MVDSADHITGKAGLAPTVTIRKPAGAFAAPIGAVTEIANGWYKVAGNATDTNALGQLLLHASAAGADPTDDRYEVVAFDPQAALATPTNITGGVITTVTNAVALPAIPANWITAAGINAGAFNGKGDWANAGAAMSLTVGERNEVAKQVEIRLVDEADTTAVLTAIVNKINATDTDLAGLSIAAITAAVAAQIITDHGAGSYNGSTLATQVSVNTLQTTATAIKGATDKFLTMVVASGPNWSFTVDAVKNAPSGGGGGVSNPVGDGDTPVDHNTGDEDNYRVTTKAGAPIDNATLKAYLKTDYDAGNRTVAYKRGTAFTNSEGRWVEPMMLNAGMTYTVAVIVRGYLIPTFDITVPV